jgi:hypothetical protein
MSRLQPANRHLTVLTPNMKGVVSVELITSASVIDLTVTHLTINGMEPIVLRAERERN